MTIKLTPVNDAAKKIGGISISHSDNPDVEVVTLEELVRRIGEAGGDIGQALDWTEDVDDE